MSDPNDLTPGTWNIDPVHSNAGFVARHLMISKVRGRFTGLTGAITVPEDRLQSSVEATIDVASVATGDQQRDAHLRSADFFDVENYPTIEFRSTGVERDGRDFVVLGDLTIKGITRPVELDVEFEGVGPDPWGGTRAAFSATTDVSRKEWGLVWNIVLETGGVAVSDKIRLELDIQAVKA